MIRTGKTAKPIGAKARHICGWCWRRRRARGWSGEDLGTVPPYVRPSLQSLGIAGFKIPQWETTPDGNASCAASEYERLSVATYATHDHKPLRAFWDDALERTRAPTREQARADLEKIAQFAGIQSLGEPPDYDRDFYLPVHARAFPRAKPGWRSS